VTFITLLMRGIVLGLEQRGEHSLYAEYYHYAGQKLCIERKNASTMQ
jgi:hypothetical protein